MKNKLYHWQASKKIIASEVIYAFFKNSEIDTYQYLKAFEAALPSKMKVQYYTCTHQNEIVAIAFLQQFRFSAFTIKETNILKKAAIRFFFNIIPCHLSYCGSLFCIALPGMAFKKDCTTAEKAAIINELQNQHGTTVTVIKDVKNKELFADLSKEQKVFPITSDSTMELNMQSHWKSFEDYLADLQHKYRQKAKKVIKQFEGVTVKELLLDEVIFHKNKIYELYLNVLNKQTFRLGMVEENYFIEMKKGLKDNFIVTGYFLNEELIAFRTAFLMQDRMEIHFIGFDYETNKNLQVYFNILYDNIKFAVEKNVKVLELGRTAQDAKRIIGALPKQFDDAVYFKSNFFKKAFEFLYARYNNNDNSLPLRNPFKPAAEN